MWRIALVIIIVAAIYLFVCYVHGLYGEPFDVVYTWVDEYDPERDQYMGKISNKNELKYRYNNNDELLYSIRSLEKYCKDVNNIFIVVKDGQIPSFIDFSNPKYILVNHSEIMPKSALPTFNSCAIELCLHKIPNLLDRYVYFNDDIFVNKKLTWNKLFSWNRMPKVNIVQNETDLKKRACNDIYNFFVTYDNTIRIANKLCGTNIENITISHTPSVCYKPWEYEIEDVLKASDLWYPTLNAKFRDNNNIILNNGFRTIYYLSKGAEIANWGENYIEIDGEDCRINKGSRLFFCVNKIDERCRDAFKKQMTS